MSQESLNSIKHELLDFAENISSENFAALSSGIGLGKLVPKMEKRTIKGAVSQLTTEEIPRRHDMSLSPSFKASNQGNDRKEMKVSSSTPETTMPQDTFSFSDSSATEDLSKVNVRRKLNGTNATRGASTKVSKQRNNSRSLILAHLIDLSLASIGFMVVFIVTLGFESNWDQGFLVEAVTGLGVAYMAAFSYGSFILYHFVFRMLKIRSLGKIITKRENNVSPLSSKGVV